MGVNLLIYHDKAINQQKRKVDVEMKLRTWKKLLVCAMLVLTIAFAGIGASACTTLYVGANLTEEGTAFVARTEDYGSDMNKLWFISEAGAFKAGDQWRGCPAYGEFEWTFTHDSYRFTYFTNDIYNGAWPECGEENPTHWSYTCLLYTSRCV